VTFKAVDILGYLSREVNVPRKVYVEEGLAIGIDHRIARSRASYIHPPAPVVMQFAPVAPSPRNSWIVMFSMVLDVERRRGTKAKSSDPAFSEISISLLMVNGTTWVWPVADPLPNADPRRYSINTKLPSGGTKDNALSLIHLCNLGVT